MNSFKGVASVVAVLSLFAYILCSAMIDGVGIEQCFSQGEIPEYVDRKITCAKEKTK